jgi:hypothetical protein
MKFKIKKRTEKPFKGSDGDMVPYFWYVIMDLDADVQREAGTLWGEGEVGKEYDREVVPVERSNGKKGWNITA